MEQKPMDGLEPLDPPSAEVARLYLEEAQVVEERREKRMDRRAIAVQSIVNAVVMAIWVTVFLVVTREGSSAAQLLTMLVIVWGQLAGGMAERSGAQWRMPGATRWYVVIIVLFAVAMLGSFFALLMIDQERPLWMYGIPGGVALLGFGGLGVVQLWRSRGQGPRPRVIRPPLSLAARRVTAIFGALLAISALAAGLDDALLTSLVAVVVLLSVVAWIFAWSMDFGLPALGASWRWPQWAAFAVGAAVIMTFAIVSTFADGIPVLVSVAVSVLVLLLFGGATLLDARRARETQEADA